MKFEIVEQIIDIDSCRESLMNAHSGGYVSFEGWVRDHNEGSAVRFLEYEAFEELANKEAAKILQEAKQRYEIEEIAAVHRVGSLQIGEIAVWIGASSAHRDAAFRACRYVIDEIKTRLPVWKKEHYVDGRAEWVNCQECYKHSHHYHDDGMRTKFYSRQMALKNMGPEQLAMLSEKKAVVIGAGGLGCPVLKSIAGAGIGHISIYDDDVLDVSNLHRQDMYKFTDAGQAKAVLAEEHLRQYNPFIEVKGFKTRVEFGDIQEIVKEADLVFDCTDNFNTKFLVHDACLMENTPLVQASIYQYEGEVQLFENSLDSDQACLRCLQPEIPHPTCVGNCAEVGVMGYTAQIVGHLQAKIGIDHLLGVTQLKKLIVDLDGFEVTKIKSSRKPDCAYCGQGTKLDEKWDKSLYEHGLKEYEISEELFLKSKSDFLVIDIRDDEEKSPKDCISDIDAHSFSEEKYAELDSSKNYLVVCQRGIRSYKLVERLRDKNLNHFYSLQRGIESLHHSV